MYTAFYGLSRKPFNMTPDPAFLFLTDQHREALAGLTYAILDRKGFLALSGIAGSGKTTLLAWTLQKLPVTQIQSSVILNPTLTRDEFIEMTMLDFGMSDIPASKAQRLWNLQKFLLQGQRDGKVSVLIVDEAHKLSPELLEEIRLLGNFECADQKLLQVVLIGQKELDDVLSRPELWQFKQRISVRLSLKPLGADEVSDYIQHRWKVAGGTTPAPFSPEAIASLVRWTKGIPRLINSICDNALILGFADAASSISADHIDAAARDLCLVAEEPPAKAAAAPSVRVPAPPPAPVAIRTATPAPDAAPASTPAPPSASASAPPVRPFAMRSFERYGTRPARQSFFMRCVSKLGLA
jgi:general secretion pathway protein A